MLAAKSTMGDSPSPPPLSLSLPLLLLFLLLLISLTLRVCLSLSPHSGQGSPPLFGDFEAQRHWLEVSLYLPLGDWYRHTPHNDLLYWGLDYPPLTAFVSWMFARLAVCLSASTSTAIAAAGAAVGGTAKLAANGSSCWVSLLSIFAPLKFYEVVEWRLSRGRETLNVRLFMRATVLLCDCIVWIPSVFLAATQIRSQYVQWCRQELDNKVEDDPKISKSQKLSSIHWFLVLLSFLISPGLLLIDHGHFQYNGVCIGLTVFAVYCICSQHWNSWLMDVFASIFFCLSLNFKQMALYYSPVFFFVLLNQCNSEKRWVNKMLRLAVIGATVIATFAVLWLPFCIYHAEDETCMSSLLHVLHRLFPFSRGIFEDKVANIWYTISVLIDIREIFPMEMLVRMSLCATLLFLSPLCYFLCTRRINVVRMYLALVVSSFAFFLLSFQVHEKSILLAAVPATLLLPFDEELIRWFQLLSMFTMYPLLKRDKLQIAAIACSMLYWSVVEISILSKKYSKKTPDVVEEYNSSIDEKWSKVHNTIRKWLGVLITMSYVGMVVLHTLEYLVIPPDRYPDLYPALFAMFGALNFLVLYIYFLLWLWWSRDNSVGGKVAEKLN